MKSMSNSAQTVRQAQEQTVATGCGTTPSLIHVHTKRVKCGLTAQETTVILKKE